MHEQKQDVTSRRGFLMRSFLVSASAAAAVVAMTMGAAPAAAGPLHPKKPPKTKAKGGKFKKKIQKHKMKKEPLG